MSSLLKSIPTKKDMLFCKGTPIRNMLDIHKAFTDLNEEEFAKIINTEEYATWVKDVFQDKELANNLLHVPDKTSALFCLESRIKTTKPKITVQPEIHTPTNKLTLTPRTATFLIQDLQKMYTHENNRNSRRQGRRR